VIRNRALDDLIIAGLTKLIDEAEAEKAALHAERKK